eukprot:1780901-Rhodomonas_salina.1
MQCLAPLDHFVHMHTMTKQPQPSLVLHMPAKNEDESDVVGKKRGRDSPDSEDNGDKGKAGSLRLTDAIDKLAAEEVVLRFDRSTQLYVVLDGPGFEARFDEVRCTRAKRSGCSNSRPFSRMHSHYSLVRGEKWAKTGSAFRAKDAAQDPSRHDQVHASKINITIFQEGDTDGSQVTLQHFLNVTGAGDLFRQAGLQKGKGKSTDDVLQAMQTELASLRKGQEELRTQNSELKSQNEALRSLLVANAMQAQLPKQPPPPTNSLLPQAPPQQHPSSPLLSHPTSISPRHM